MKSIFYEDEQETKTKLKQLELSYKEPKWQDSILQERMLRIGREARFYKPNDVGEIERIARHTLRKDFLEHQKIDIFL